MGHDLHAQPPVVIHGVVAGVGGRGGERVCHALDDRRDVLGAAVAVRLHLADLLVKVLPAVVLAHNLRELVPHLVGDGFDALGAVQVGAGDEVAGLHNADHDALGLHLVAQAVGEGFHTKLGDAVG